MYHRPNDVKATLPRPEALKSKKAKAELRPSSVVLKSKKATPSAPTKATSSPRVDATVRPPEKPASAPASGAKAPSRAKAAVPAPPVVGRKPKVAPSPQPSSPLKGSAIAKGAAKAPAPAAPPPPKKPARKSIKEAAGVSTDAVARRTGKTWDDWFEVLDSAGAATLDQRGIVAILAQKHGIGPWWQQMIAVGYESLRAKSEKPAAEGGFHINETCTLVAPLARAFKLWNDASERARWLADDRFVVKSATPGKTLRARWGKGNSQVAVSFAERAGKTEVSVEHQNIESRAAADQMKAYWQKKLGLLDEALAERS
jgi:uncharacterized protein YndB with AHSA1/START domain